MDENYGIGISLNIDGIQPQIQGVEKMITDLQKFTDKKMKIVNQTITNGAAAGIEEFTKKMEALKTALSGVALDKSLVSALSSIGKIAGAEGKNIELLASSMTTLTQSIVNNNTQSNETQNKITAIGNMAKQTSTDVSALAQMIAQVTDNVNTATSAIGRLTVSLNAIRNNIRAYGSDGKTTFSRDIIDVDGLNARKAQAEEIFRSLTRLLNELSKSTSDSFMSFKTTNFLPQDFRSNTVAKIAEVEQQMEKLQLAMMGISIDAKDSESVLRPYLAIFSELREKVVALKDSGLGPLKESIERVSAEINNLGTKINFGEQVNESVKKARTHLDELQQKLRETRTEYTKYSSMSGNSAFTDLERGEYAKKAKELALQASKISEEIKSMTQSAEQAGREIEKVNKQLGNAAKRDDAEQVRKANEEKRKSAKEASDEDKRQNEILSQQNKLLSEKERLTKGINDLETLRKKNEIDTGTASLTAKQNQLLADRITRLHQINAELTTIKSKYDGLSTGNKTLWDNRQTKSDLTIADSDASKQQKINEAYAKAYTDALQRQISLENEKYALQEKIRLSGVAATAEEQKRLNYLQQEITVAQQIAAIKGANVYATTKSSIDYTAANKQISDQAEILFRLASAQEKVNEANAKAEKARDIASYKKKYDMLQKITDKLNQIAAAESKGLILNSGQDNAKNQLLNLQTQLSAEVSALEAKGIDEITAYRTKREAEANAAILADAIKTENERAAEAKRIKEQEAKENLARQQASFQQYLTSYQGAMASANKLETNRTSGKYTDTYENRARVIEQLRAAMAKLNAQDSQYERKMGDLIEKLRKLTAQQKAYEEAIKGVNSVSMGDALAAVSKANQTKTLKDMTTAYEMLKKAMENMNVKSADWKKLNSELKVVKGNIDRVKQAMGEMKNQTNGLNNSMLTLKNYMLAAFSVQQITGYIKKMVNVRAQFELQNTALRAILQNKDEADRIFKQVQDMAMQSPFTIMQLTTYTKQLAAYRIEAEKLVGTTKMLADVSAGLGVDIQRLILAYGQVKSANYLRATEVRQFTEAGLNIAGELSEYLSEVNGKMISVADVMDMISKRMVKFEDVEEVFNRITSAGGIFYDMQKKQADTLYGQIQRISDALSLMMNDIGQSNEGIIKGALSHIRELIKSWREFIPLVYEAMATLGLLGTVKAIQGLAKIGSTVRKLITSMRLLRVATDQATAAEIRLQNTSKMFWANVGWTAGASAAIALILTVVNGIINMNAELRAFRENLSRIETESTADMNHSVKRFGELADTIRDATKTYDEKRAAMEELQRTYKDILPDQMLQIENIKSMADGYQEATEAIREYYTENLKQKSREALDQQQQDAFKKWQDTLTNFAVSLKKLNDLSVSDAEIKGLFQRFSDQVYNEILNGQTKIESAEMRFRELLQNYFGLEDLNVLAYNEEINKHYDLLESIFNRFTTEIFDKFSNELIQFNERIDDAATLAEKQQREQAKGVIAEYETAKGKVNEYVSALEKVNDLQKKNKLTKEDGTYTELGSLAMKELEDAVKTVNALRKVLGLVPLDFEAVKKSISSTLAVEMSTQKTLNETLTKWIGVESDKITTTTEENGQTIKKFTNDYLEGVLEKELRNINKLDLSDTQKEIQKLIKKAGEMNNVELGNFRFAMLTTQSTVHSVRTEVEAEIKELETSIKEYDNAMATGWAASTAPMFFLQGKTKEEIQTYIKALKDLRDALGGMDNQHSGADKVKKEWQDRIKAIEDFYKQADTLEKHFDISTTTQKLTESFNKLFDQLKLGTGELSELGLDKLANGIYNPEALMKALQKLKEKIPAGYQDVLNSLEKTISDTSIQIGIDVQTTGLDKLKTEVDDVFASYDLTKELQDLGLGVELTYLVGGKPMTKEDLENYVNTTLKDLLVTQKKYGDDGVKAYEDYVKKLTQVENKEREDRIKSYSKYLTKTYGELAKIRIDAYKQQEQIQRDFAKMGQDLQKMLDDPNVSTEDKLGIQKQLEQLPDQARRAAQGVNEEMNKALNDAEWKNFKDSGMLAMLSTDIENMTVKTLRSTKAMLEEQLTNGSEKTLAQQKEILNDIAKIIDQIGNKRPFTEFFKSAKKIRQLKKDVHAIDKDLRLWGEDRTNAAISTSEFIKSGFSDVKTETETLLGILDKGSTSSESFMVQLKKTASDAMENINSITTYLTKTKRLTTEQTDTLKAQRESWRSILSIVQKIQDKNGELDATTVGDIQTQLSGITDSADAGIVAFANLISWLTKLKNEQQNNEKQTKKWREVLTSACSAAAQNLGELSEMFQALGEDETSAKIFFLQFTQQILSAVPGIIAAFTAVNAAAGIIGIIAEAVSLLATSVTFWANAKEKKKEKAINNLKLEVEKLADAYDRLSDAMENATDIDAYNRDYEKAQTDIQARIEKYQDMLEIARSKKKKDASEIYEYEQAIAELEEESAELQKQRIQDLGGLGSGSDYKSQAEDWASAWLDAFKETGDGLDALNDNWEDFIDNLFVKQFVATKAAKVFEKYFKMIDDAIDAGFSGADLEGAIAAALKGLESENEELNKLATALAKVFGITQDGTDNLSDLQKGIQNITEDQAAAIESYMNSVRFYVAQQNDILLDLVNVLKSQYDQSDSPLLSVVKEIRSTLNAFSQRFSQVTRPTPNGWVVKVQ